ncbi:MAG: DNA recombination protein RmuC, partial [Xanthobacteraceae bacterium]
MNEILFVIDGTPIRVAVALMVFGGAVLALLLAIAIIMVRGGSRGSAAARAQAERADELEARVTDLLRAQAEAQANTQGRVDAMGQALANRQAEMAR